MATSSAPSTIAKRTTVWRLWIRFIRASNFSIPPIQSTELHICLWLVWLFRRRLTYNTVQTYLFSLSAELKLRGGRNILQDGYKWFIHSTMKHFLRSKGNVTIKYRRPLTVDLLNKLLCSLDFTDYNTRVFATMLTIGVYCLLRIGELCHTKAKEIVKFISNKDFVFKSGFIELTLWQTKTDSKRQGIKKYIVKTNAEFCPYDLLHKLKVIKSGSSGPDEPFFTLADGRPVSRYLLVKFLRQKMINIFKDIDINEWSGISLRKGGATSALRAGVAGEVIQRMGNWRSDVYKTYIDHTITDVATAQLRIATMHTATH
jgi:integrase